MSTYVISDVQGCYDELCLLLERIQFDPARDILWFVGDLVNRGRDSLKTLAYVKNLSDQHIVILGNHDLHLLAVANGDQTLKKEDTFQDVLRATNREEILYWLQRQKFLHYDETFNLVMTHAGIYPAWSLEEAITYSKELFNVFHSDQCADILKQMYSDEPSLWRKDLIGIDRYRFFINAFTRMRYCNRKGQLELNIKGPPEEVASDQLMPWFKVPNRACQNVNIVFGHWAALNGVTNESQVFAIDTGCVWGHDLTALSLESLRRFSVTKL